ncbi:MAG: endonuclease/exonuclease/phosphatase family protein [Pirellulaceae bacterium]|nr:endonuclease/exonuclease/phosphatase family protein [Pirellulaceae bacterium]
MKTSLLQILLLFSTLTFPLIRAQATEPLRLRVLSYNIHHGAGVDGQLDLERIAKVILAVKPDLVALQEVDQKTSRSQKIDQPAELARLTKMHVAFGANIEFQGGHYGNAILSRFPIAHQQNHLLPNVDDGEQRGVLAAEISIPQANASLRLLATHFDHRTADKERVLSAQTVNALVEKDARPALLMGDLNDVVASETLNLLTIAWSRTNAQPLPTVPVDEPVRQIDFILFRPRQHWKVIETRVLDEAVASDHRAIFSVLEFRPGQASQE